MENPVAVKPSVTTAQKDNGPKNKPVAVAIVLNTAWNIYNFRLGLIKALQKEGYKVFAIAPADEFVEKIKATGCEFLDLPNLRRKGTNPIYDLRLMMNLYKLYKKYQIALVLHYTIKPVIFGTISAKMAGVKAINTMTGLGYTFLSSGGVSKIVRLLYKFSLTFAEIVLFQNQDDKNLFLRKKLISESKCKIVKGSGINTSVFKPSTSFKDKGKVNFLFIGRLLYDKGIVEFVEAAKIVVHKYPTATFDVVGDLDLGNPSTISEAVLQKWIADDKIITYHGQLTDVRPLIEKSDTLVLPSYREGLPRVMLEGMAMAKPLITTDVPGCRDTVRDGYNGILVEAKNVNDLANAMIKIIETGFKNRVEMGRRGRKLALTLFDEKVIIENYLVHISNLLGKVEKALFPEAESLDLNIDSIKRESP